MKNLAPSVAGHDVDTEDGSDVTHYVRRERETARGPRAPRVTSARRGEEKINRGPRVARSYRYTASVFRFPFRASRSACVVAFYYVIT